MQYAKEDYWNERYDRNPDTYDWYQDWTSLKPELEKIIFPEMEILQVGAGTSLMSEDMFTEGFSHITNTDLSGSAIRLMAERYSDKGEDWPEYVQIDVRAMEAIEDGTFDCVLDKALLDAVLCGDGGAASAQIMLMEIRRVLKPGGLYVCISHAKGDFRLPHLQKAEYGWNVEPRSVRKPMIGVSPALSVDDKDSVHHIYVCRKSADDATKKK